MSWQDRAACRDYPLTLFFPFPGDEKATAEAIAICGGCQVTAACREFAIERRTEHGVWAGEDFSLKRLRRAVPREETAEVAS